MDSMATDDIIINDGREICKVCGKRSNMSPINGMCWLCYNTEKARQRTALMTGVDIDYFGCPASSAKNLTSEQVIADTKTGVNPGQVVVWQGAHDSDNYASLFSVLKDALHQAADGKGKERHANDDPFERQSICEITRKHGLAFATGQAAKKLEESHRLLQLRGVEAATNEILGAINYAAAAVIVLREGAGE